MYKVELMKVVERVCIFGVLVARHVFNNVQEALNIVVACG